MRDFIKKHTILVHILFIILVSLLEVILVLSKKTVLGSGVDWFDQSVVFFEYFRNLFYETGNLFPDLSLHIGGGQNMYYFVYYGLFSPYLLLFYLLPFVRAGDFIMVTSFLNLLFTTILFYFFLIKNGNKKTMSLFVTLLLLVCSSLTVRSYIHVMFVNYMPFLMLGLFATKRYFEKGKSLGLILIIVLIITTNYYFSIPSIISLCMYALYYYIKTNDKIKIKCIIKDALKYILRIFIGILISSFLLIPVMYTIVGGRETTAKFVITLSEFIPKINIMHLLYSSFGVGLSSISWLALFYGILYFKKENRVLSILLAIILLFPIFNLIFNGFLYLHGKVYIPFMPLILLLVIEMLKDIKKIAIIRLLYFFIFIVSVSLLLVKEESTVNFLWFYCEMFLTIFLLFLYKRKNKILFLCPILFVCFFVININIKKNTLIPMDEYESWYKLIETDVSDYVNNKTDSIYRYENDLTLQVLNYSDAVSQYRYSIYSSTSNGLYSDIFYNNFNNNNRHPNIFYLEQKKNLFFLKFMGVRYLAMEKNPPVGYEKILDYETGALYENKNVYSIGFASSNLLSYEEYNKLSYIEKLEAYIYNIIIDGESSNSDLDFNYEKVDFDYEIDRIKDLTINYSEDKLVIESDKSGLLHFVLNERLVDKAVVIRFKIDNSFCNNSEIEKIDLKIKDVINVYTCDSNVYYNKNEIFDYVLSDPNGIRKINLKFTEGIFDISNIEIYTIDISFFEKNNTTPIKIDFDKTKGDHLYGSIDVEEDGYFMFTIPYDKGYTVYVDNEEVEFEKVNDGFIGFKISKGSHDIHLTFEAPYAKLGRLVSLIGLLICFLLCLYEHKKTWCFKG